MVAGKSPDSLPSGWTVQVKVKNGRKSECYSNVETGQKFYSKNDFERYIKATNAGTRELTNKQNESQSEMKPTRKRNKKHSERKPPNKLNERHSERETTQLTTESSEVPEWLPKGWTMGVKTRNSPTRKKYKFYSNVESGKTFYTKNEVMRYIETGNVHPRGSRKTHPERKPKQIIRKENEVPEWLPNGWTVELKTRTRGVHAGASYKCYIDPETGCKFYTKPEVFQFLQSVERDSGTSKQKNMGNGSNTNHQIDKATERESSLKPCTYLQNKVNDDKNTAGKVVIERHKTPDELPPGWIKEIKIQKKASGIRKDPYYTDPVSGYVFRSTKDALRFLETGDINTCAIKPQKRDVNKLELKNDETPNQIDKTAGCESFKTPKVSDNLETVRGKLCTSKQKKVSGGKHVTKKDVFEKVKTPDELPSGWIKEIKIQKKASGIRKDPYYTDPVSGYMFRSIKDALRYLETGDINKCAIIPRKRVELENDEPVGSPESTQNSMHRRSRRELFSGKDSCDKSSLVAPETRGSKTRQAKKVKILKDEQSLDNVTEVEESSKSSGLALEETKGRKQKQGKTEVEESSKPSGSALEETKGMRRRRGKTEVEESPKPSGSALEETKGTKRKRGKTEVKKSLKPSGMALEETKGTKRKGGKTEVKESSKPSGLALEETKGTKRKRGKTVLVEDGPHSASATEILQDDKLPDSKREKLGNKKMRNPKYENNLGSPSRSSKRLLGITPELEAGLGVSERILRDAARKSSGSNEAPGVLPNNVVDTTIHIATHASTDIQHSDEPSVVDTTLHIANQASTEIEHPNETGVVHTQHISNHASTEIEDSNQTDKPLDDLNVPQEPPFDNSIHIANHASTEIEHPNETGVVHTQHISNHASSDIEDLNQTDKPLDDLNVPQEPPFDTNTHIANHASTEIEPSNKTGVVDTTLHISSHASSEIEDSNKTYKPLDDNVPQEPVRKEGPERGDYENTGSQFLTQLGNSWSDPCLEFAYKTLTGSIPFEDNPPILPQEEGTVDAQRDGSSAVADFGLHSFFQDDLPSRTDIPEQQPASVQQFPLNPVFPPTGAYSSPSGSNIGPQNPSFEGK